MLVVSPVISSSVPTPSINEKKKNEVFPKCIRTKQAAYPCKKNLVEKKKFNN